MSSSDAALELRVAVDVAASRVDAPLRLGVTLANVGGAPVLVNARLALNSAHAPEPFREVVVEVVGPDGKQRPFLPKLKIGAPGPEHVLELAPGAALTEVYDLDGAFDLSAPGAYAIRAFYASSPVADAHGRPAWREQLASAPLTISRIR